MVQRFKSFNVVNIFLLVVFTIFMRVSVLMSFTTEHTLSFSLLEPFAKLMIEVDFLSKISYTANLWLATFFVLLQAFFLNFVINNHLLFGRTTLLPALIYVIVSSIFPQFLTLSAPLMVNFLLIWMFAKVVRFSKVGNPLAMMFDMGLIVAAGTLIYFPFITMFLVVLLGLLIFRPFYWREWFAGILGFVTVYLFVAVFYYWNNSFGKFIQIFEPFANKFPSAFPLQTNDYLPLIPLAMVMIGSFWLLRQNFYNNFVATRKTYQWLFYTFLVAILSFYLRPGFSMVHFVLAVPSAAVFSAYYFNFAKNKWIFESMFWLLVFSIQYFHFV